MVESKAINIQLVDHVVLRVVNLQDMVDFYCDVLGCRLERGPEESGLAQLRAGLSLIDLVDVSGPIGQAAGSPPDHGAPNLDHFCLQLNPWNPAAIQAHLEKYGVEVGEIANRYGAQGYGPSLYIRDPEGNMVELKGPPQTATGRADD